MIKSAEEFARLRTSDSHAEQMRAGLEEATAGVWLDVVTNYPHLRQWVALNKTVPIQILELLAGDIEPMVRSCVADKRKLTPALRSLLAKDIDASVRVRVVYNAKCEIDILEMLANDPEDFVRDAALTKLSERRR